MKNQKKMIRKILSISWQSAPMPLFLWALFTAVNSLSSPLEARIEKLLFDIVQKNIQCGWGDYSIRWIIIVISALFSMNLLRFLSTKLNNLSLTIVNTRIKAKLQKGIIEKLRSIPCLNYEDHKFYNLLQAACDEINNGNFVRVNIGILGAGIHIITMTVMFIMLSKFSIPAAIIAITYCIPGFMHQYRYGKESWKFATSAVPKQRKMSYYFNLVVSRDSFKENKLYDLPPHFMQEHDSLFKEYYNDLKQFHAGNCLKGIIFALLHAVGTMSVYVFIYISAAKGEISLGDAVMYTTLASSLYSGVQYIVHTFGGFNEGYHMSKNLITFLDIEESMQTNNSDIGICEDTNKFTSTVDDEVVFRNVRFSYPGSSEEVLKGVSFHVKKGQKVAIAGENGSGKTTLVKLLIGLYPAKSGDILIKSSPIETLPKNKASVFSTCFQDFFIYSYTIRENIGFGNLKHLNDENRLYEAAHKSGFMTVLEQESIEKLEQSVNKDFDTNGLVLSGGQSQKLALARTFVGEGDIIILDEPSASLDVVSEFEIFKRTMTQIQGKTVFFITHRLSNVVSADMILYLKDGKITEKGTHKELMKFNGEYAKLFRMQSSRYQS